ncbi:MAG: hypothetical protein ABIN36_09355 [Ferruginibacter sp.]
MMEKEQIFSEIQAELDQSGFTVVDVDRERPWGGFFVINENDAKNFIDKYFPNLNDDRLLKGRLSPKILLVAPNKKLSWQYHSRRSEIWSLVGGSASVVTSDTDIEAQNTRMKIGQIITLKKGERHRLVGLNEWGIVAEIWVHTDLEHLSDESDIVRLHDDFGR